MMLPHYLQAISPTAFKAILGGPSPSSDSSLPFSPGSTSRTSAYPDWAKAHLVPLPSARIASLCGCPLTKHSSSSPQEYVFGPQQECSSAYQLP